MIFNTVIAGSGGPGETVVEAKAVGIITGAIEDDKVLLIPTDIITSSPVVSGYTEFANNYSNYMFFPGPRLDLYQVQGYFPSTYEGSYDHSGFFTGTWNSSADDFDSTSTSGFTLYSINYHDEVPFAAQVSRSDSYQNIGSVGFYVNGQYNPSVGFTGAIKGRPFTYIDKHVVYHSANDYYEDGYVSVGTITGSEGNYSLTVNKSKFEGIGMVFPVKYNNTWYFHLDGGIRTFDAPDTTVYSFTYPWSRYFRQLGNYCLIDDDVDYIFCYGFYKIIKSNSTWTTTLLTQPTNLISEAIQGGIASRSADSRVFCDMQTKDYGDYVDIIMATSEFGYDGNGNGNKLAHFRFTKATETLERLNDIFADIDQSVFNYTRVCNYQVNWDLGLISISLGNAGTSPKRLGVFVAKPDDMAGIYKYFAVENVKGNYYTDKSITGFVKSNEGTDDLGNTVVKVKTAEDPNYIWTPPVNRVFGMNVTVNEGEPL